MNTTPQKPRGIYVLPNLFTIAALFFGFFSIISSFKSNYDTAAMAIFIAMIMDTLDGKVARLTNTMTSFGAEFDSLSDMVSFSMAPAILAYSWSLYALGKFGWTCAFIYTVAVALRLARFNTQIGHAEKKYFQGLPCPAAAAVVASLIWICFDFGFTNKIATIITAVAIVSVGILMVSNIRYRSFKDLEAKNSIPFVIVVAMVLIFALISIDPPKVLFTVFAGYAISGPITTIWELRRKKRLRKHQHHILHKNQ